MKLVPKCRRSTGRFLAISFALFATLGSLSQSIGKTNGAQAAAPQDVLRLLPGSRTEREIKDGEAHSYSLSLVAGEFVRLVVESSADDLVMSLQNWGGNPLAEVDSAVGFWSRKRLSVVAQTQGDYRLTVRPARKGGTGRTYTLSVAEWRRSEPRDQSAVAAERAFAEAVRFERENRADSTRSAIGKYDEAVGHWRAAGDRIGEAFSLLRAGLALHNLSRFKEAIDRYNQALPIFEQLHDDLGTAHTLTSLGWAYSGSGQHKDALDYCNRSLEIRRRLGEPRAIAQTLNLVAGSLQALGEDKLAIDRYLEALPLARAGRDPSIEAFALNGLAWLYIKSGEYEKGLDCVDQALALWRRVGNVRGEAQSLHLRGTIHSNWVHTAEAMESFQRAIGIWRDVGNRYGEAEVLNNIGTLYQRLGDYQRAKQSYLQAIEIWKAMGNRNNQAKALSNLGLLEWRQEKLQAALDLFQQSLDIQISVGNRSEQAIPLHNLGAVRFLLGESARSLDYLERALKIYKETGQRDAERDALSDLGFVLESLGDDKRASEHYRLALPASAAGFNLARLESKHGRLVEALTLVEEATTTWENRRQRISDRELRVSFGTQTRALYELHADILMRLRERAIASGQPSEGYLTAALEVSEYAHARALLETLEESRVNIRQGADPALIAEERAIQDRLNAREARRAGLLDARGQEKLLAAIESEIQDLEWQLNDVRSRIRARSPAYAALTEPSPLNVAEIRKLLDDDTILLEYLLGDERSFLWVVTPSSVHGYALPGRKPIEEGVRRFYELLSAPPEASTGRSNVRSLKRPAPAGIDEVNATLSHILLDPVAGQLGKKRLVMVSDGALNYMPFAVLQSATAGERKPIGKYSQRRPPSRNPRPLIADHEIISVPSGSVLAALRRESATRKPAEKSLAVLADAVFSRDDPRVIESRFIPVAESVTSSGGKGATPVRDADNIASAAGLADFTRLRFSRQEADYITSFLPASDRLEALDFAASRATAQSQDLAAYRILHFATHGILNSKHPDLSGLVFSTIDEQGRDVDGFLRLSGIYNLKVNAELVVLSSCQTALGKEVRGEGLIGLVRGFMYAGAPRVVASLWRVDDRATAELMKRFYRGMLQQELRPAAALRAAQVSMLGEKRWAAPYYWAAFTIQGEWR